MSTRPVTVGDCIEAKKKRDLLEREREREQKAKYDKRVLQFENSQCADEVIRCINEYLTSEEMNGAFKTYRDYDCGVLDLPACTMSYTDNKYMDEKRNIRVPIVDNFVNKHYNYFTSKVHMEYEKADQVKIAMYFDTKVFCPMKGGVSG